MSKKFKSPEDFRVERGGYERPTLNDMKKQLNRENLHMALATLGMAPGIGIGFDAIDTVLYLAEERYGDAAISSAAMMPIIGQVATAGKIGKATQISGEPVLKAFHSRTSLFPGTAQFTPKRKEWAKKSGLFDDRLSVDSGLGMPHKIEKIKNGNFVGGQDLLGKNYTPMHSPQITYGVPKGERVSPYALWTSTEPDVAFNGYLLNKSRPVHSKRQQLDRYWEYLEDIGMPPNIVKRPGFENIISDFPGAPVMLEFHIPVSQLSRMLKNGRLYTNDTRIYNRFGGGTGADFHVIEQGWKKDTFLQRAEEVMIFDEGLEPQFLHKVHRFEGLDQTGKLVKETGEPVFTYRLQGDHAPASLHGDRYLDHVGIKSSWDDIDDLLQSDDKWHMFMEK